MRLSIGLPIDVNMASFDSSTASVSLLVHSCDAILAKVDLFLSLLLRGFITK